MLEIESAVAGLTSVEFGLQFDLSYLDALARLSIEIVHALGCRPGIDIQDFDATFAVPIFIAIDALWVKVVLQPVEPLLFAVVGEVVDAFILELERVLVLLVLPLLDASWLAVHRLMSGSIGSGTRASRPEGR